MTHKASGIRLIGLKAERLHHTSGCTDEKWREQKIFVSLTNRRIPEKNIKLKIRPTQSASSVRLEKTARKKITVILALKEDAIVELYGKGNLSTKSSPKIAVLSVIHTTVDRAVVEPLQNANLKIGGVGRAKVGA